MKTWDDIEKLLKDYERVNTAFIYVSKEDREDSKPLETVNAPWGKDYPKVVSDEQIITDMHTQLENAIAQTQPHMYMYIRVYPEITRTADCNHAYFRLLLVERKALEV